jgi:hypothetical protein
LGPFPSSAMIRRQNAQEVVNHLANVIATMVTEGTKTLGRMEKHLLFKATQALYVEGGPEQPTLADWLQSLNAVAEESQRPLAQEIQSQVLFWLEGPYRQALLRNRVLNQSDKLTVWNIKNVHDKDTQNIILALLSGIIAQSISFGPTIVVMDEVWSILKSHTGPELVESLYRTVRKEGSAIWSISQSMSDYAALPAGCRDAILNNSPIKMLLAHEPTNITTTAALCNLNERETSLLQSLRTVPGQYSELLSMSGQRRQIQRLIPTGIEYWLATSNKKDTDHEAKFMATQPSLDRFQILKHLARKYPNGALSL